MVKPLVFFVVKYFNLLGLLKTSYMKITSTVFIFSALFFITTNFLQAQDFQGKAYYMSKTTIDMANFGGGRMDEDMKKRVADRMKNMLEKTYILTFNKSESIYKEDEKLEAPGTGRGGFGRMMVGNFAGGNQYKNIKSKAFLQEQEMFGKKFLIKDSIPDFEWRMTGETKQIGQYTCFKAVGTKIKYGLDVNFRRSRQEKESENKRTTT